ncbi:sucrose-specific PTS transporter subunit IIBC [Merdibacter massiliensis]|uniref:sucrose-specific PTS transporter subunit IIBC n=1 Tax=Merdibacter massiliensis TaxID=1871030 RepID=UPI00096A7F5D|nr:sucrose-specific PTS transporter subunit IIBC [Merdibacter massiliensis]
MDYAAIAAQIIEHVGGKDNIRSVQHCATRLRFQLKNADLRNEEAITDIEAVKGVFMTNSQFQIILGSGLVNLVCDEVQKQIGMTTDSAPVEEEKQGSAVQRFIKMFSDIFVPIIPAIVAGGLLMGINNVLTAAMFEGGKSIIDMFPQFRDLASAINIFANAPFTFLPVLIGFSATKRFGGNPYLGAAMGMIMVHPDLLNAYSLGTGVEVPTWNLFGLSVQAVGYQGTVLPVLAVSWILANIEKRLHKVTPTWLDNLTTPLLSIMVTAFITFLFVGPVLRGAGNILADGITWLYNTLGPIGGGLFGLVYAPITLTGMHHSFIPIETQLLASIAVTGGSFIFITASMNNVAQGAAVLAVLFKTKDVKLKSICSAAGVSALLGITEPAMFGVTLKLRYPFYAAMAGSAVGSAWCALFHILAQALGAAGLPGFISVLPQDWAMFGIGLLLSMLTSAIVTLFFWNKIEESSQTEKKQSKKEETPVIDEEQPLVLLSAVNGKVQDVTKSSDAAFASGGMGKGVCIDPTDNMIYAPCDGKIAFTFPTKHALGLVSDQGVEIMIHCGIDTVNMEGEGFETLVSQGEHVHAHTPLIRFDSEKIKAAGNSDQTMMIITNSDQYDIEIHEHEAAGFDAPAITVRKKAND